MMMMMMIMMMMLKNEVTDNKVLTTGDKNRD